MNEEIIKHCLNNSNILIQNLKKRTKKETPHTNLLPNCHRYTKDI